MWCLYKHAGDRKLYFSFLHCTLNEAEEGGARLGNCTHVCVGMYNGEGGQIMSTWEKGLTQPKGNLGLPFEEERTKFDMQK